MAVDREIPGNCLGNITNASCVKIGIDIPELDIKAGDNLNYAIQQLAGTVEVEEDTGGNIDSNLYCLGGSGSSICASKITNRTMTYTLTPGVGVLFGWDLTAIRDSLPSDYNIISIEVAGNSASSVPALFISSSPKSSVTIASSYYPVVVTVKIRITTPCGQIELSKTINLYDTSQSGSRVAVMELADFTTSTIQAMDQNGYNELLARELCNLRDQIAVLQDQLDNANATIATLQS